ncbi:hypothetical protein [Aquipuribacter sp. MA13-6]|uniref:hypothetical protein n=1 Tax=unclassified Aquipuribacter TaxID=2635084 RepID=UPI003EED110A
MSLAAAAVVLATPLLVMAPASADHVVDAGDAGCRWGAYVNPTGMDLWAARVSVQRDEGGAVVSYTCHFRGIPAVIPAEDRDPLFQEDGDWHLPKKALRTSGFTCFVYNDWDGGVQPEGDGEGLITPAGTARVTCAWPSAPASP